MPVDPKPTVKVAIRAADPLKRQLARRKAEELLVTVGAESLTHSPVRPDRAKARATLQTPQLSFHSLRGVPHGHHGAPGTNGSNVRFDDYTHLARGTFDAAAVGAEFPRGKSMAARPRPNPHLLHHPVRRAVSPGASVTGSPREGLTVALCARR